MVQPTRHLSDLDGRLVENVVHFARALRKAGVRVGTAQVETALRAVEQAGFTSRIDFYHTLRATMIHRSDQLEVFHQVFAMFWRDPEFLNAMMHMLSPQLQDTTPPKKRDAGARRAADALGDPPPPPQDVPEENKVETEAALSWSALEVIRTKDFEQMSAAELREAEKAIATLSLDARPLTSRRLRPTTRRARPDARATLRASMRRGGEMVRISQRAPEVRPPDLVAICDVSGSMATYARMVMRFLHALGHASGASGRSRGTERATKGQWGRLHTFTFGTELTNISRAMARGDADAALEHVGQEVRDWEGGTRIGPALEQFNKRWSRRVLGRGAVVLLITDGLERDDLDLLDAQMKRLALSSRRLIWLNPLLRWDGFAPLAGGIRTMLPHVDSLHACHSVGSLMELAEALNMPTKQATTRPNFAPQNNGAVHPA